MDTQFHSSQTRRPVTLKTIDQAYATRISWIRKIRTVLKNHISRKFLTCHFAKWKKGKKLYLVLDLRNVNPSEEEIPSTGVTSDTRGNFGHYINFPLFRLFLIILCTYFSPVEFLTNYRLYFFRILYCIGRKTKLWPDMNVSKWRHMLKNWWNLSWSKSYWNFRERLWNNYFCGLHIRLVQKKLHRTPYFQLSKIIKISYKNFYGIFDGVRSYPISWGNFGHWNLLGFSTSIYPFRTKIHKLLPLRIVVQMKKTSSRNIHSTSHKAFKRLKSVRSYPGWRYDAEWWKSFLDAIHSQMMKKY